MTSESHIGYTVPVVFAGGGNYDAFVPAPLPDSLELADDVAELLGEAERVLDELRAALSGTDDDLLGALAVSFRRADAVASSRIENIFPSYGHVVIGEYQDSVRRFDVEMAEVVANFESLVTAEQLRTHSDLDEAGLLRNHKVLMNQPAGAGHTPGKFRTGQVVIGNSVKIVAVMPPADYLAELFAAFTKFLTEPPAGLHPLVRIGLAHWQYESIHPFSDGNGRSGRALIHAQFGTEQVVEPHIFPLSRSIWASQFAYYGALNETRYAGDYNVWLRYFLSVICDEAERLADDLVRCSEAFAAFKTWAQTVASQDWMGTKAVARDKLMSMALLLFEFPIVSNELVAERLGVSLADANHYLAALGEARLVEMTDDFEDIRIGEDMAFWLAPSVLEAFEIDRLLARPRCQQ